MALQVATAAINALRDNHYVLNTVSGLNERSVLMEGADTNLVVQSGSLTVASGWTLDAGTETLTQGVLDPTGGSAATTITPAASTASGLFRAVTFTADGVKAVACFIKQGTSTVTDIGLYDGSAATFRGQVRATWSAGVPTLSTITGSVTLYPVESLSNGWYRINFAPAGVIAANANQLHLFADKVSGTGSSTFFGPQAANAAFSSSYIPTTVATVTRGADSYSVPFTTPPQAMTLYSKFVERGTINVANARILAIGTGNPRLIIFVNGGFYQGFHNNGTTTVASTAAAAPAIGDTVELRLTLAANGAVQLGQSINGAAEVVAAASASNALAAAWSVATLWLGEEGVTANNAFAAFLVPYKVALGVKTLAQMQAL